eukprot:UN05734
MNHDDARDFCSDIGYQLYTTDTKSLHLPEFPHYNNFIWHHTFYNELHVQEPDYLIQVKDDRVCDTLDCSAVENAMNIDCIEKDPNCGYALTKDR